MRHKYNSVFSRLTRPCNLVQRVSAVQPLVMLTFDESVDLGQSPDDGVPAVPLLDVNLCRKQAVGWLRVDQGHTHSRLGRQKPKHSR